MHSRPPTTVPALRPPTELKVKTVSPPGRTLSFHSAQLLPVQLHMHTHTPWERLSLHQTAQLNPDPLLSSVALCLKLLPTKSHPSPHPPEAHPTPPSC